MVKALGTLFVTLLAVGSGAYAASTARDVQALLTIPALATLSVRGTPLSGREIPVSVDVPTAVAVSPGELVELREAVVLVVRSNVPWTLVVRPADLSTQGVVQVRPESGKYRPVGPDGLVLAQGGPGVHQIVLDYRVSLDGGAGWSGGRSLTLVYAVGG